MLKLIKIDDTLYINPDEIQYVRIQYARWNELYPDDRFYVMFKGKQSSLPLTYKQTKKLLEIVDKGDG